MHVSRRTFKVIGGGNNMMQVCRASERAREHILATLVT